MNDLVAIQRDIKLDRAGRNIMKSNKDTGKVLHLVENNSRLKRRLTEWEAGLPKQTCVSWWMTS